MIKSIKIRNFKSIENMVFDFEAGNNIICLLGKNGSGKSTIFKAINFFFDNINKKFSDEIVVDKINPYIQKCTITITFNFHLLKIKSKNNQKLESEFDNLTKFSNGDEIEITITQYKDGIITWDTDNSEVLQTIKKVFIVNRTTIEGELITLENIDKFLLFLDTLNSSDEEQSQHKSISMIKDIKEKTVKIICECNGRTEIQDCGGIKYKHIVGGKTGGWVNEWLEFYFKRYISSLESNELKLAQIKSDFPSLTNTLQIITNMVK